jgi:transposase
MPSPVLAPLTLADDERVTLAQWIRRPKTAQALALRARIILACAEPEASITGVAQALNVTRPTVGKWRRRFVERRLEGLLDEPRPGAPRSVGDDDVEEVIRLTLETTPEDATHWSTRRMARRVDLSPHTIMRIWHAFGLQPHRVETFKLSKDPQFIDKVRDIVGLYLDPPAHALVLCVDEKTQVQALDHTAPLLPLRPGQPERRTHDYTRHGTTSLFAAYETRTGAAIGECFPRHRSVEFRKFLDRIDDSVPLEFDVHLILDNASTHKTDLIKRWFAKRPRFHVHFTPTSSSWINLVERLFSELRTQHLDRSIHRSVEALEATLYKALAQRNVNPKPFVWTKTADEILASVKRFCQRISQSGH